MSDDRSGGNIDIEQAKLDLDRYKAQLDFRKFIFGSVFAAVAIAAIPPLFQYATAYLEYVKSEAKLKADLQQFRDGYVKDFINTALNQDIELRIRFAEYFSFVSSESHPWRTYLDDLKKLRAEKRKEIDELEADWEKVTGTLPRNTGKQNELDRHLLWAYNEVGYVPRDRSATSNPRAPDESRGPGISLASIPPDKRAIAQLILDAFASAGFGQLQQVAALANAIAESNLDPNAQVGDDWGLFLLNRSGGLGAGHTPEELKDPTFNVNLVVGLAKRVSSFGSAKSLDEAVSSFVRFISRPANLESQVISRQRIARSILQV